MKNLQLRPGIILIELQNCYFLAAAKEARKTCGYVHEINDVGAFIWKHLDKVDNITDILSLIKNEYDIPFDVDLEKDVRTFLGVLKKNHFVLIEDDYEI